MKNELPFSLERTIVIRARRATVFSFFTDSARFAKWWGAGSEIEPRPGGRVYIRYPNAITVSGEVVEMEPLERIVFTYGYESGQPIPPGASRVTITLEEVREGTRVRLRHDLADAGVRDHHVQGWRYQMAMFSNVVCEVEHAGASDLVDKFLAAWGEPDAAVQAGLLAEASDEGISFHDKYSSTEGLSDLQAHLAAAAKFMPGVRVKRSGAVLQCQGCALVPWVVTGPDGKEMGRGHNLCDLAPGGKLARVVGFWGG